MDDQKQLFLFVHPLPSSDSQLIDRIKETTDDRNKHGAISSHALSRIEAVHIRQMVVGPNHVAFLFENGRVARLGFQIMCSAKDEHISKDDRSDSSGGGGGGGGGSSDVGVSGTGGAGANTGGAGSGNGSSVGGGGGAAEASTGGNSTSSSCAATSSSALNRNAKIRRVMMAARRPGGFGERAGVIVDRTRPLVPLASIPEDLIAQAQVVLQGKSREVIVRELQRTNLNVNEAVNNLLSRDDEEGDEMDESAETYLPEELLSLLDAGLRSDSHSGAGMEHSSFYATGDDAFEYVVARDLVKRRADRTGSMKLTSEKKNEKTKENQSSTETVPRIITDEKLQFWSSEEDSFPSGVTRFTKIAAMRSELIALGDNGCLYGWSWSNDGNGSMTAHPCVHDVLSSAKSLTDEKFVDIVSCSFRAVVATSHNRVASFMDYGCCGRRVSNALMLPLSELPEGEKLSSLYVCPMYAVIKTQSSSLYWW
ncbi:hypothetical protein AB6A40_005859 [Gnathostoma spinigerum]|uniref:UBA domain-containing protein n=1 Tax=Gnathostoma spinigerum TaxID=75299 RepID=A0ABD6EHU1_9BILA